MAIIIQPSDDPHMDACLIAQIEQSRRLHPDGDVLDWDEAMRAIGEDPDE